MGTGVLAGPPIHVSFFVEHESSTLDNEEQGAPQSCWEMLRCELWGFIIVGRSRYASVWSEAVSSKPIGQLFADTGQARTNGGDTADRPKRHDGVDGNGSRSCSNRSRRTCSQTSRRGPLDGGRCSAVPSCDWVCIFQPVAVSNTDKATTSVVWKQESHGE